MMLRARAPAQEREGWASPAPRGAARDAPRPHCHRLKRTLSLHRDACECAPPPPLFAAAVRFPGSQGHSTHAGARARPEKGWPLSVPLPAARMVGYRARATPGASAFRGVETKSALILERKTIWHPRVGACPPSRARPGARPPPAPCGAAPLATQNRDPPLSPGREVQLLRPGRPYCRPSRAALGLIMLCLLRALRRRLAAPAPE